MTILADERIVQVNQGDRIARRGLNTRRLGHAMARSYALDAAETRPYDSSDGTISGERGSAPTNDRSRTTEPR